MLPESDASGKSIFVATNLPPPTVSLLREYQSNEPEWTDVFTVRVKSISSETLPPIAGDYRLNKNALEFQPYFPLSPGLTYVATFRPPASTPEPKILEAEFLIPSKNVEPTVQVSQVYPTSDMLPENLLKFYLHFSAPVSQGRSYRYVHLLDSKGAEIELPFLELDQELWDSSGTRLTLLLDPGRVKRDLKPHEEAGAVLEAGKTYTLVIDRDWPDANGIPLMRDFRKTFQAGPADYQSPDPTAWSIEEPPSESKDALIVRLNEPLDHALLQRLLWIENAEGQTVPGNIEISNHERTWAFTPDAPWNSGNYHLVAHNTLEDLCGNSIGRPFEVSLTENPTRGNKPEVVKRTFEIVAPD